MKKLPIAMCIAWLITSALVTTPTVGVVSSVLALLAAVMASAGVTEEIGKSGLQVLIVTAMVSVIMLGAAQTDLAVGLETWRHWAAAAVVGIVLASTMLIWIIGLGYACRVPQARQVVAAWRVSVGDAR